MSEFDGMSPNVRRELVRLAKLVRELQEHPPDDMEAALGELTKSAARSVPGAQYAGITVARRPNEVETASATGRYPVVLDEIQRRHREGPCLTAAWVHHTIRTDDLAAEERWPRYRGEALAQTPIRSILAFRLFSDSRKASALNLYAEPVRAFDDESVDLGLACATYTTLAWVVLRRDEQFRSALASRDIIGQAKGVLMERFGVDADKAFLLLRRLSQETNTPVADISQRLLRTAGQSDSSAQQ
jgi:hypothetical protein